MIRYSSAFLVGTILTILAFVNTTFAEEKSLITVNQFVNHIALDAVMDGLEKSLTDRKIVPQKAELMLGNSQGNISTSVQLSNHHASFEPKFMVAIATPSAQTGLKALEGDTILAFVAVTDPKAANLTGHENVIGVSDNPPISELIDIVMQVFPDLKTMGIISNSGEINSVKITESLEKILSSHNVELKKVMITSSNDIKTAMNKLIGSVDLIYLPQDNSVVSALSNIVSIARKEKLPLIASDPTLVEKGVLLALGSNYFKSGEQLGHMIADMFEGKKLEKKIQAATAKEFKINHKVAKELNLEIPQNIKSEEGK